MVSGLMSRRERRESVGFVTNSIVGTFRARIYENSVFKAFFEELWKIMKLASSFNFPQKLELLELILFIEEAEMNLKLVKWSPPNRT
jgi:hypothetical protein